MNVISSVRRGAALFVLTALFAISTFAGFAPARAQAVIAHRVHHKLNFVQRHPTLTAIGAGVATHHALKVAAAHDKARGRRLNWAERHPTLSGMGVGVVTHHEIKKHAPAN